MTSNNRASANGNRYVFDEFEIDPANRMLLRNGVHVPLSGKVFDVLLIFAENPGQLLTKEKLIDAVWGTEFIEEGNVAKAVSNLRKVLGDTGREHKYIDTVHGHGYRFAAAVGTTYGSGVEALERKKAATDSTLRRGLVGRSWAVWSGAAAILIGAASTILIWNLFSSRSAAESTDRFKNPRQTKLSQSGNVYAPTISRDGKYFAFEMIGDEAGGRSIGLQRIGENGVQKFAIASGSALWGVSVAPDNHYIYYVSRGPTDAYGSLFRISLTGGATNRLADSVAGFSVSPDGSRIAVIRRDARQAATSIILIDSEGSDEQEIFRSELETAYYSLDWDPDGRNLLYSVWRETSEGELRYVARLPVSRGPEVKLDLPLAEIFTIRWLPDKTGLIASAPDKQTGQPQLFYIPYPAGEPQRITADVDGFRSFSITADGRTIVAGRSRDNRNIWITDEKSMNGSEITHDTEKHFDSVEWLGKDRLIFDEDELGSYRNRNLWSINTDGTDRRQLTSGDGNNSQPTVSPDGKSVVFVSHRTGRGQLWKMNPDGSETTQISDLKHNVSFPRFGGSGAYIYYSAWVGGMNEIWKLALLDGTVSRVVGGVDVGIWAVSPDEKVIIYSYFDPIAKGVVTVERALDGVAIKAIKVEKTATWIRWAPDSTAIYMNSGKDLARGVWKARVDGSNQRRMLDFENQRAFHCAWSRDVSRTACVRQVITFDAILIKF